MIFHVWLGLRRRADTKPHRYKSILLIEHPPASIHLERVKPKMQRGETFGVLDQIPADPLSLKNRMYEKLIQKIPSKGKKSSHVPIHFSHPDIIILKNYISKILTVLLKCVPLLALEIRKRLFPGCAPKERHGIKIIIPIFADHGRIPF